MGEVIRKDPGEVTFEQIVEGRERSEPQMYKSEEGNQQQTQILEHSMVFRRGYSSEWKILKATSIL